VGHSVAQQRVISIGAGVLSDDPDLGPIGTTARSTLRVRAIGIVMDLDLNDGAGPDPGAMGGHPGLDCGQGGAADVQDIAAATE
jgi:hypothetical protein